MGKLEEQVREEQASILIVEDESIVALDIRNILLDRGFRVAGWVANGEDALKMAESARPDLVLMDIHLGGGMSGIEVAEAIRRNLGIPSLFLTSFSDSEILQQAKNCDPLGYILKPFQDRDLEVGIEIALHRWAVESGLRNALPDGDAALPIKAEEHSSKPVLVINTLGRFNISLEGRTVARLNDFSESQRELLCLLLCAPMLRMSRRNIQLALWPDSSPRRARSSFDSLLLRLRKNLGALIAPHPINDYLQLHRGILCLENSQVDVLEFARHYKEARAAAKKGDRKTAETSLEAALELWQGPFMAGTCDSDHCFEFQGQLEAMVSSCTTKLAGLLVEDGRLEEAVETVARTLQVDLINDSLIRYICQLLKESADQARVKKVLHHYEHALRKAGFAEKEIAGILADI